MGPNEVTHAEIGVSVDDQGVTASLRAIEAEYTSTMARIDAKEANAHIGADLSELHRKLKEADAELKKFERQAAKPKIGADQTVSADQLRIARETRDSLRQQVSEQEKLGRLAKDTAETRKIEAERLRAAANQQRKISQTMSTNNRMSHDGAVQAARQAESVAKLQNAYVKATDEVEKFNKAKKGKVGEARIKAEVQELGARAKMERLKAELNAIGGHPPVKIRVDVDKSEAGRARAAMFSLRKSAEGLVSKLSSLGGARLSLGPISGSLRTFAVGLTLLGPIITGLVGGLGALVGVVGTGLVGAMGLGAAAMGGAVLAGGGLLATIKPMAAEFKTAKQATDAYDKAVLKYGAGSKEATKAQQQMNNVLKNVDPLVAKAAKGLSSMGAQWRQLTGGPGGAKESLGQIFLGGIEAAKKQLPTLATGTNQVAAKMREGFGSVFKQLGSPGASNTISTIMKNFADSLPAAIRGLGKFGAAFGHIAASASRFLPMMTKGFEGIGDRFNKLTLKPGFDQQMARLVQHAVSLARFFGQAGRTIATFFNLGANSGKNLVDKMTAALKRWQDFMRTPKGKNTIEDFFRKGVDTTIAFTHAVGPLLKSFLGWSTALQPITTGMLKLVSFLTRGISAITHMTAMKGPLAVLGATIAGAFVVTKIASFVTFLGRAVTAMKALGAASMALSAGKGLTGAMAAFTAKQAAGTAAGTVAGSVLTKGTPLISGAAAGAQGGVAGALFKARFLAVLGPIGLGVAIGAAISAGMIKNKIPIRNWINRNIPGAQELDNLIGKPLRNALGVGDKKGSKKPVGTGFDDVVKTAAAFAKRRDINIAVKARFQFNRSDVTAAAQKAVAGGVPLKKTLRIIANSRNAHDAITKIQAALRGVRDKHVKITAANAQLAASAQKSVQALFGIKDRRVSMFGNNRNVVSAAEAAKRKIAGVPGQHGTTLSATGNALGQASAVKRAIDGIPLSKTSVITTVLNTIKSGAVSGAGLVPYASGGSFGPSEKQTQRAYRRAAANNSQRGPGVFNRPTLLVGDEDRREFVITENPAYRERNVNILHQAAGSFGMNVVEAAARGRAPRHAPARRRNNYPIPTPYAAREIPEKPLVDKTVKDNRQFLAHEHRHDQLLLRARHTKNKVQKAKLQSQALVEKARAAAWKRKVDEDRKHLRELQKANRTIRDMNISIDHERTNMVGASQRDNMSQYNAARGRREGDLRKIKVALDRARALLPKGAAKDTADKEYGEADSMSDQQATQGASSDDAAQQEQQAQQDAQQAQQDEIQAQQEAAQQRATAAAQGEQQLLLDTARTQLGVSQATEAAVSGLLRAQFGSGDVGTGRGVGASGSAAYDPAYGQGNGATVVINTLHPGDPRTLQAVAAAATSGMGMQGYKPRADGAVGI